MCSQQIDREDRALGYDFPPFSAYSSGLDARPVYRSLRRVQVRHAIRRTAWLAAVHDAGVGVSGSARVGPMRWSTRDGGMHKYPAHDFAICQDTLYDHAMTYVITSACISHKDASCVVACPVDCIHPTRNERDFFQARQLYVDPLVCVDCGACADVCPWGAPYPVDDLLSRSAGAVAINAAYFARRKGTGE
jgi:NAD-dependent dihydropyrimidine dehydrogenase PreA subunit